MSEAVPSAQEAAPARISEDWLAVLIGLGVFALALLSLLGVDALGWVATTAVWTDPTAALAPVSKAYATLGGGASPVLTYLSLLAVLSSGAAALGKTSSASPSLSPPFLQLPICAGSSAVGPGSPR